MNKPGLPGGKTSSMWTMVLLGAVAAVEVCDDFDDLSLLAEAVGGQPCVRFVVLAGFAACRRRRCPSSSRPDGSYTT